MVNIVWLVMHIILQLFSNGMRESKLNAVPLRIFASGIDMYKKLFRLFFLSDLFSAIVGLLILIYFACYRGSSIHGAS